MTALELFCSILKREMSLSADQIYLWDQKINLPIDQRLYVAVGVLSCKPFANIRKMVPGTGGILTEQLFVNMHATLSVDIISRGPDARDRKEEVILALKSTYSQQVQEANGFYVATLPSGFQNLSEIDGAAIPYRFNISVAIQYQVTKTATVDRYETFTKSVIVDA
jgi:hypothetical protein